MSGRNGAFVLVVLALVASAGCGGADRAGAAASPPGEPEATIEWGLVVHGGAGTLARVEMTPETADEYRAKLTEAMEAGHAILADSGAALDAVVAAIRILEDSPLFNAGKGAVFDARGGHSLDASIMDGTTGNAGAIAAVTGVKNPIELARLVMDSSGHVVLMGDGAEEFGRLYGVEAVEQEYYYTEYRWQQLEEAREEDAAASERSTVGVVALDRAGRIAAGTSTGGTTNKRWGRVGDSPIVGAGTYAGPECGVSGTGTGEYFIRNVVAYDICARMRYTDYTLAQAAHAMVMEQLEAQAPELGGIIALDARGHVVMMFNTEGMYRGWIGPDGVAETGIYR